MLTSLPLRNTQMRSGHSGSELHSHNFALTAEIRNGSNGPVDPANALVTALHPRMTANVQIVIRSERSHIHDTKSPADCL